MTILEAMSDERLFAPQFAPAATWDTWRVFLAALFALPLGEAELALYRAHTGRRVPPEAPAGESWVVVGRRGGKSRVAALVAVYLGCFRDFSRALAPGERGTVMLLAEDRRQARVVFRYIRELLTVPLLAPLVAAERAEGIDLTNGVTIEVHTASFRTVRGYTVVAAILDEVAFWRTDDAAEPDHEIVAALRPGMATVPGALLLGISSPYARRGVLWQAWREHYGRDGSDTLVWQAPSEAMNPTILARVVERAYAEDPTSAAAEWGAEFRTDVESFLTREAIEACCAPDCREQWPRSDLSYFAFVDPSGGSGDSMTLAVAHREEGEEGAPPRAVLDLVREVRPPFSPESVVAEFTSVLRAYRLSSVEGDRYAGEWPRERFSVHGIDYRPAAKPKSELYRELLPLLNSGRATLLDLPRLVGQLAGLERRTARGGRDSIDHAPGAHDDVANAAAGALVGALAASAVLLW